jgi:hypothetical protein
VGVTKIMKNGVTPQGGPQITPVVYLDLPLTVTTSVDDDDVAVVNRINEFPNLLNVCVNSTPNEFGEVVHRVEGPLDEMVAWLGLRYGINSTISKVSRAKLAR